MSASEAGWLSRGEEKLMYSASPSHFNMGAHFKRSQNCGILEQQRSLPYLLSGRCSSRCSSTYSSGSDDGPVPRHRPGLSR
jgi:hypothetical protein